MRAMAERDAPLACPVCGSSMRRVLSVGTSFKLVGKGWAKDGYQK